MALGGTPPPLFGDNCPVFLISGAPPHWLLAKVWGCPLVVGKGYQQPPKAWWVWSPPRMRPSLLRLRGALGTPGANVLSACQDPVLSMGLALAHEELFWHLRVFAWSPVPGCWRHLVQSTLVGPAAEPAPSGPCSLPNLISHILRSAKSGKEKSDLRPSINRSHLCLPRTPGRKVWGGLSFPDLRGLVLLILSSSSCLAVGRAPALRKPILKFVS